MVIEMMDGSLLELPEMRSEVEDCDAVKAEGCTQHRRELFAFIKKFQVAWIS